MRAVQGAVWFPVRVVPGPAAVWRALGAEPVLPGLVQRYCAMLLCRVLVDVLAAGAQVQLVPATRLPAAVGPMLFEALLEQVPGFQ